MISFVLFPRAFEPTLIGHFRAPKTLTFKMKLGAQPFKRANEFYLHENENDSHIKGWAPTLVLKQRPGELGNGLS